MRRLRRDLGRAETSSEGKREKKPSARDVKRRQEMVPATCLGCLTSNRLILIFCLLRFSRSFRRPCFPPPACPGTTWTDPRPDSSSWRHFAVQLRRVLLQFDGCRICLGLPRKSCLGAKSTQDRGLCSCRRLWAGTWPKGCKRAYTPRLAEAPKGVKGGCPTA